MALGIAAPAAGAPTTQVVIATVLAGGVSIVLFGLIVQFERRSFSLLGLGAEIAASVMRMPGWAALPLVIAMAGLGAGGLGVFWDISIHITEGRDAGPLANPSHYPILFALYSCFAAGVLAVVLHARSEQKARHPIRLPGGMRAPVGGVLLMACGGFALSGFPLDDLWHRMFGQDVTLWGPTHLVMINGAILSVPCLTVLVIEGRRAVGIEPGRPRGVVSRLTNLALPATLLFAISFWAAEFDWGIPQYRQVWHPLLLAAAAGVGLVSGRMMLGRGGALVAVLAYLALRGVCHLTIDVLGEDAPALPLFVVEAVIVELVFLGKRNAVVLGALAGLLCGTLGFAAECAWSHAAMPLPWAASFLPEAIPTAAVAGTAGGVLGALLGCVLQGEPAPRHVRRPAGAVAGIALVLLGANALWTTDPDLRATVSMQPAGDGRAIVSARFDPPEGVEDAGWANITAWQGGGLHVVRMKQVSPGLWRAPRPVPVSGKWKTALRVQKGRMLSSIALYLPADEAVPTPGIRRPGTFTAAFKSDHSVMQTERRDYVPGWLWTPAALLMLAFCFAFIVAISRGLVRAVEPQQVPIS